MTARPFRLTAPEPPESELQHTVAALLTIMVAPPAFWFSAAIGATKLTPQQAAALSRAGVKRGLPDFFIISPEICTAGQGLGPGRVYGIELKTQHGKLSRTRIVRTRSGGPRVLDGQEDVFPLLEAAGMTIAVCRTADEVLATLTQWKIPLRGRIVAAE